MSAFTFLMKHRKHCSTSILPPKSVFSGLYNSSKSSKFPLEDENQVIFSIEYDQLCSRVASIDMNLLVAKIAKKEKYELKYKKRAQPTNKSHKSNKLKPMLKKSISKNKFYFDFIKKNSFQKLAKCNNLGYAQKTKIRKKLSSPKKSELTYIPPMGKPQHIPPDEDEVSMPLSSIYLNQ